MAFNDGDFLEIDYSLWSTADSKLIATTDEQKAKGGGIYNKEVSYGPALVILGSNTVVKGLDSALRSMGAGEQKKLTLRPEEAFGNRNEGLVRVMPMSEFRKSDINPYPGMEVTIDNAQVVVKSVNSGRVVVDANHPYAGREVTYDVKIVRLLSSNREKIEALGKTYAAPPTNVEVKEKCVELSFSDSVKKNADYFVGKANLVAAIFSYLKDVDKVTVDEEYNRPKEQDK